MIRKLKRIGPLKFGIVVGAVYGLLSLFFIPFFLLGLILSLMAPHPGNSLPPGIGLGVGIFLCILMPILYAVLGFIFGALGALIYNLVAQWTGGIEFEVE